MGGGGGRYFLMCRHVARRCLLEGKRITTLAQVPESKMHWVNNELPGGTDRGWKTGDEQTRASRLRQLVVDCLASVRVI